MRNMLPIWVKAAEPREATFGAYPKPSIMALTNVGKFTRSSD